ncbi:GGDEF domain-containing protein [Deinococcus planocerae]|uniref:GGDEF domain-containing protein n=1 Tax=Deinococcus planocerae TaxID=1737569 RepID=UPI000C7EA85F|nr:diguanylate cyclase [Deinococcus planocerae]
MERRSRPAPPPPDPGEGHSDAAQALRRRAYLGAVTLVAPALGVVWGLQARQPGPDPFVVFGHPALLALCAWGAAWLLRGGALLPAERVVAVAVTLALLGRLALALTGPGDEAFGRLNETCWLLVVVACVGFLMFSARQGLWVAGGLYALTVLAPWVAGAGEARLLQVQLTCGVVLALLYSLAWYRERFLAERGERLSLERLANTDPLTGLPNRRALYSAVGALLSGDGGGCLILFDLDHFKRVNDLHGHGAGDEVLVGAARRVRGALRGGDHFGRWGGEEFLVVLPGLDLEAGAAVAERLRLCLAARPFGAVGRVTASFGVAGVGPGDDLSRCTARADAALYRAKAAGRDRVACEGEPEREGVV